MRSARLLTDARLAALAGLALVAAPLATAIPARASHDVDTDRVSGPNRFETAAEVAAATYPDGADVAFLARADDFADALAAAPLARQAGGPILLTGGEQLSPAAEQALEGLGVSEVVLLGGTAAISDDVESALEQAYSVARIAGATRYETAAQIATAISMAMGSDVGTLAGQRTVFVARGDDFPDALAIGAVAAAEDDPFPILLTPTDELHPAAADAIGDIDAERAVIVGGGAAVSEAVAGQLGDLGLSVQRLAGPNRLATAAAIADFAIAHTDAAGEQILLARSDLFPDALAAGPYAGTISAPILLAPDPGDLGTETTEWFDSACLLIGGVRAVGGGAAVSEAVLADAAEAAQACHGTWGAIPDAPILPRINHTATWSGDRMLVWGGEEQTTFAMAHDGAAWDPQNREWRVLPPAPVDPRWTHEAAWTGDELIVWGGSEGPDHLASCFADGAAYDQVTGTWAAIPDAPGGGGCGAVTDWTGDGFIVLGGSSGVGLMDPRHDDGAIWDPATESWTPVPSAPIAARSGAVGAWTGDELIVFGGSDENIDPLNDGAAYDPDADSWRTIPDSPLAERSGLHGVWTGGELIVFGGFEHVDAAAYDPAADSWRSLSDLPAELTTPATAWTGDVLYVVGAPADIVGDPDGTQFLAYVVAQDSWIEQPNPLGSARSHHAAVWTGQELLVWGGTGDAGELVRGVTWRPPVG